MTDPLGLSIGTTNLVAASVGQQPVIRRSVLTVFGHAAPEVGTPPAHRGDGVVLSGFVDRIGDSVPLVAADGASYPAEQLLVEALESMAGLAAPQPPADVAIAVPSYWTPAMSGALHAALRASSILAPGGMVPRLIPDAVAALTALNANPGINRQGVVALLDFGGGGTSITLADAASAFTVIDGTDRFPDFAGDQIDQALLSHVLDGIAGGGDVDPGQTAAVGSLASLREQCRSAKERLSRETVTGMTVELPGYRGDIRVTRAELEELIARPLTGVVDALDDMLGRNNISWDAVSAVALVGGGASIPLIVQRLSERSRARVVTTPQPALDAGVGAALFAAYGRSADTATWVAPAAGVPAPPAADPGSSTFRALAWSQDDDAGDDVVPYSGEDPYLTADAYEPTENFEPEPVAQDDDVKPWQRLPMAVFGIAAALALVAVGGVAIALTSVDSDEPTTPTPGNVPLSSELPPSQDAVTITNEPVQPPPPAPTTAVAPPPAV
ncbi:MAG: Hsp70 family protein, partial [Mycobacterium sp.]